MWLNRPTSCSPLVESTGCASTARTREGDDLVRSCRDPGGSADERVPARIDQLSDNRLRDLFGCSLSRLVRSTSAASERARHQY